MNDPTTDASSLSKSEGWRGFRRGLLFFFLACCAVWLGFFWIYKRFPYLQPGSNIVTNAKRAYSLSHPLFDGDAEIRILAFGNSKTLASFNPKVFDAKLVSGGLTGKVQSVNEALPGERRFVVYLDQLLAAGARPTHVLIQFPPIPEDHEVSWAEWIKHDKMIVDTLFPFRTLPRDFTLFVFAALGHGGVRGFYRESADVATRLVTDRGYYFLKGQSHYAGDRLPDDYRLPTDSPTEMGSRPIDTRLPPFVRLAALADRYGFKVVFFPPAYRVGELAAAPVRKPAYSNVAAFPQFSIAGDDYWLLPPRLFSDPVHPNIEGADLYSARLAELLLPVFKQDGR